MEEKNAFIEKFKKRTKDFTLRNIKVFQSLPKQMRQKLLANNFFVLRALLVQITEQFVEQEVKLNFTQN